MLGYKRLYRVKDILIRITYDHAGPTASINAPAFIRPGRGIERFSEIAGSEPLHHGIGPGPLYPAGSEERRQMKGVLARKKSLGIWNLH